MAEIPLLDRALDLELVFVVQAVRLSMFTRPVFLCQPLSTVSIFSAVEVTLAEICDSKSLTIVFISQNMSLIFSS